MKKNILFLQLLLCLCLSVKSQVIPEISDSMIVKPNMELLRSRLENWKNTPSFRYFKDVKDIPDTDLDDALVINQLEIWPDTVSGRLKYNVDKNLFFIYFPSVSRLFIWQEPEGNLQIAKNEELNYRMLCENFDFLQRNIKIKPNMFAITFFPNDRGRRRVVAYKRIEDKKDEYIVHDFYYNAEFHSLREMIEYLFFSRKYYVDIYKKRTYVPKREFDWIPFLKKTK
jgi:hypothetical protein